MTSTDTQTTAIELKPKCTIVEERVQRKTTNASEEQDELIQASIVADSEVPDGGYGWVVIFGCAVITWWFVGTCYCWGVTQAALVEKGISSPSTLSFVGSMTAACNSFLGVLHARVIRKLGTRIAAIFGIFMLGFGELLSGFSTKNVGGLFVTTGVVAGIGSSLCFMIVSVTPAQYFKKKRGIANGVVYAAGGLGGAVISFMMNALLQKLGPAWAFRVLGFVTMGTGLPAAYLVKERTTVLPAPFVEWKLFRDIRFTVLFLGGAIGTFPLFVPPFFLPIYTNSINLSTSTGAALVAGFNFSSAVGRLVCGFASDKFGPLNTLFVSLLVTAGSMLILWPFSEVLAPLVVFVIINGMSNGGFFATMPTVVGNVFGSARVSVAMAMIVAGWAGGYLMGAPIAGYILNASGGKESGAGAFRPAIFYAGSMALVSSMLVAFVRLKINRHLLRKL